MEIPPHNEIEERIKLLSRGLAVRRIKQISSVLMALVAWVAAWEIMKLEENLYRAGAIFLLILAALTIYLSFLYLELMDYKNKLWSLEKCDDETYSYIMGYKENPIVKQYIENTQRDWFTREEAESIIEAIKRRKK